MENLTGGTPPVRPLPCVVPCKLYFASVAITNGADIASISEILGHCDKSVTLRMYTHADKESMKRAGHETRRT